MIDHLDAKRAHIEHLIFEVQEASVRKADIGYHFRLKDPNIIDNFEEGDVVGFFKDHDGHASIQLLDNRNGKNAFMAGVISRSAYLTATPPMNEKGLCFQWRIQGLGQRDPPPSLGNLRTTTTTLSTTTGSELQCIAQARPVNYVVVVSSTTPNDVESRLPAIHKLRQV